MIDLLRRIAPTLLFTHPRHDYMLDHEQVHLLARSAAFSYPIPNASTLPLVAGSAIPWLYYCDPVEGRDPYTRRTRRADDVRRHHARRSSARSKCWPATRRSAIGCEPHHGMDEYIEAMKRYGAERGREIGVAYAEAFVQHRGHPFPQTDLACSVRVALRETN